MPELTSASYFMSHKVYTAIIAAITKGRLAEPFTVEDFRKSCPGFGEGTYKAFLYKHRKDNRGGNSELFILVAPGRFKYPLPGSNRATLGPFVRRVHCRKVDVGPSFEKQIK